MKKVIDLYLYSSIHIALCAFSFAYGTYIVLEINPNWHYLLFLFGGTWLLYSLHRIVGILKVDEKIQDERFRVIRKYRKHLFFYAAAAILISVYYFFQLSLEIIFLLCIPSILSILYILPIFIGKMRLRDYNYIKIFLVAACWAWLCNSIIMIENEYNPTEILLSFIEKFCFIFAITLPFDYRDLEVDKIAGVKTLAHTMENRIFFVVSIFFVSTLLFVLVNSAYPLNIKFRLITIYIFLAMVTLRAMNGKNDYYFAGIIDGTMILFTSLYLAMQIYM